MNKTFVTVLILIIVVFGGYFLFKNPKVQAPTTETLPTETSQLENMQTKTTQYVVTYTNEGYSPSEMTVRVGTIVIWQNNSSQNMWTASAMHPSHIVYSGSSLSEHCPDTAGTSFDTCKGIAPGSSWSFTFNKKGSWGYHDHLNASHFGKIIVE